LAINRITARPKLRFLNRWGGGESDPGLEKLSGLRLGFASYLGCQTTIRKVGHFGEGGYEILVIPAPNYALYIGISAFAHAISVSSQHKHFL